MTELRSRVPYTKLIILAIISVVLFIAIQIAPALTLSSEGSGNMISKERASDISREYIARTFGEETEITNVTYQTFADVTGYFEKHDYTKAYHEKYETKYPIDYYLVEAKSPQSDSLYAIRLHMTKGTVVGWTKTPKAEPAAGMPDSPQVDAAKQFAADQGYDIDKLALDDKRSSMGEVVLQNKDVAFGESVLLLRIGVAQSTVLSFLPEFSVPQDQLNYVEQQKSIGQWLYYAGFTLFSFVLGIAALVYMIVRRKDVHFKRGILMSVIFFVIYCVNVANMYPWLVSQYGNKAAVAIGIFITCLYMALLAGIIYISLGAGDQMWRSVGFRSWARWREPDFGRHMAQATKLGYLFGIIVLGAQSVIFFVEDKVFDMWMTGYPDSSPYNMLWPWLFPLAAWCAAIQEEAVYRMFGTVFFKKIFRNTFVAVLLSNFIWATGHALYPVYPMYSRVIELTLLGFIFSYVYLRYGFIAAVMMHATMDSILMGISMFGLGTGLDIGMGVFYMVLPGIVGLGLAFLHAKFWKAPKTPDGPTPPPEQQEAPQLKPAEPDFPGARI